MNKATEEDVKKSINYFERSIERDPDFALAYSGLADTYRFLTAPGLIPPREGMAMIKELAQKSIELDSTIAEPHTSLGWVLYWIEWNWKEAEKELKLALKLNPNSVRAHVFYAHYLYFIKSCFDEPRGHLNQAIILDPVSFEARKASIILYYCEGLYDKAHMEIGKVKEFNKYSAAAYWLNFNVYMKQRKYRPAVDELKHFMSIDTTTIKHNEIIEAVYEQSGIKGVFRWFIEIDELEM